MYKSGICDTKPATSLKRSSLEPKLLQSVYRNLRRLSIGNKSGDRLISGVLFREQIISQRISRTLFGGAQRNLAALGVWPIETYFRIS